MIYTAQTILLLIHLHVQSSLGSLARLDRPDYNRYPGKEGRSSWAVGGYGRRLWGLTRSYKIVK